MCDPNLSEESFQLPVQPLDVAQHVRDLPLQITDLLLALSGVEDQDVHLHQKELKK